MKTGSKVVHLSTGSAGVVMFVRAGMSFVNFGSKSNPFTWVHNNELTEVK
jgi:hypothetical protein